MVLSFAVLKEICELAYLQFVQVVAELLKAFFERDETCRDLRGSGASRLHHSLLVQKSLEPKLELQKAKP